ncbi:MAG: cupin domain-containing protein [Solirubrobacterales bacterium]
MRSVGAALVALLAVAPGWAQAENAYPTVDILSTGKTVVGEDIRYPTTGPAHVTASIVTILPNAETAFHRHGAPLFAYLLEGELTVDYGAKGKRVYKPGEAFMEAMDTTHRGMNLGTIPVKILAVYLGAEGTGNTILEKK